MAEGQRGRILTGARARLLVNGRKVGNILGLTVTQNVLLDRHEPIDTVAPEEIITLGYNVQWTAERVHIVRGEDLQALWFDTLDELTRGGDEFTMIVLDKVTSTPTHTLEGCKMGTNNFRAGGRTVSAEDVNGEARLCKLITQPNLRI